MSFRIVAALAALIALTLLWAAPAKAAWRRAESPNFILYGAVPEGELRRRILRLEEFDHLLRVMTGVTEPPAPNRLPVYIVANSRDLMTIGEVGQNVAGFYAASAEGIAAFVDNNAEASANEILFHEYAHHFMMQYRPGAYPAWYVEGFAEYFATARFDAHGVDVGLAGSDRAYLALQGRWLPMEQLLYGVPESMREVDLGQFYAQSWITTHYFFSTPERQAALNRYLTSLLGDQAGDTLQATTAMDMAAFARELQRYMHGRVTYTRLTWPEMPVPPPVTVTTLPPAADDLMIYQAALSIGLSEERGPTLLPRIRAAAAHHEGDPFARRVLAHAELLYGDAAAADRLLDGLLAASPSDAELLYLKGMRYLVAAENGDQWDANTRAARSWLGRAHRADENHFQTLYLYARSLRRDPEHGSANNLNVLMLAHRLAPQVSEIALDAATMLIDRHDDALAISLLRPLAANPHKTEVAHRARELIERIQAGTGAHPAPAGDPPSPGRTPN